MNGRKARALRKEVYEGQKSKKTKYLYKGKSTTIISDISRMTYQEVKKCSSMKNRKLVIELSE